MTRITLILRNITFLLFSFWIFKVEAPYITKGVLFCCMVVLFLGAPITETEKTFKKNFIENHDEIIPLILVALLTIAIWPIPYCILFVVFILDLLKLTFVKNVPE